MMESLRARPLDMGGEILAKQEHNEWTGGSSQGVPGLPCSQGWATKPPSNNSPVPPAPGFPRGTREPGVRKSRDGTRGLTVRCVGRGQGKVGCSIEYRGGQPPKEPCILVPSCYPQSDAMARGQPGGGPSLLPKPCWANSYREHSELAWVTELSSMQGRTAPNLLT